MSDKSSHHGKLVSWRAKKIINNNRQFNHQYPHLNENWTFIRASLGTITGTVCALNTENCHKRVKFQLISQIKTLFQPQSIILP